MKLIGINPKTSSEYNVIIADSSNIERKLLARFLTLNSFRVTEETDNTNSILQTIGHKNPSPDILFLDTSILGKEGSQFLQTLNSQFPEIKVIYIVSTKIQEEYFVKNKINYYITKPFLKKNLEEKLSEILTDKPIEINSKENQKKIHLKDVFIPPIPGAVQKILLFESNHASGINELENLLYPDKSLCADLLRVANSSLYGRSGSVKTLHEAISLLGIKTIKNIVIVQARRHMSGNLSKHPILKKFLYEFSTLTALISHDIISLFGKAKEYKEIFLLSSFRKMGMNILALNFQDSYIKLLNSFERGEDELINLENNELSLNHIQVGVSVMRQWAMPEIFINAIQNQDFPSTMFRKVNEIDRITRVAEILSKIAMKINLTSEEKSILNEANLFYQPKKEFSVLFGEEYYINISSHPFFEL